MRGKYGTSQGSTEWHIIRNAAHVPPKGHRPSKSAAHAHDDEDKFEDIVDCPANNWDGTLVGCEGGVGRAMQQEEKNAIQN